jgi:bifunctional non-homologous end joining protein LigD
MLLCAGDPVKDAGWACEVKWDGWRAIVVVGGGEVRVLSRHRTDLTDRLPELAGVGEALNGRAAVLDGEVVVLDESDGCPDFDRLSRRLPERRGAKLAAAAARDPVRLVAFDLLHLDGRSTRHLPYRERRAQLEDLALSAPCLMVPDSFDSAEHDLHAATEHLGVEGVVYKRKDAPYTPGRSKAWRKAKHRRVSRLVVCGWEPAEPGELDTFFLARRGSDGRLQHAGRVQYGLDPDGRRELRRALSWHSLPPRRGKKIRDVVPGIELDVAHHGRVDALRDPVIRAVVIAAQQVA